MQLSVYFIGVLYCTSLLTACNSSKEVQSDSGDGESQHLPPLSVSTDNKIVDDSNNEVLLRGVNVTSLGEYWQGHPDFPPTLPTTEADFQEMAARGVSVIRLIVHWSRIEPERGQIDNAYLDEIDGMVQLAAKYDIYSVIDMHQDAYSAFIYTAEDEECPDGTTPGKGWDGAPEWATITDGLSTCITEERNSAPAVIAAWDHFYDNTDGIQDHFVEAWRVIAERFAGRPEVAGYDLLNEPDTSRPAAELLPIYENLLVNVIDAIRTEEEGSAFRHLLFIEPTIPAGDRTMGIVLPDPERMGLQDEPIVNATHNYAESIDLGGVSLEQLNSLLLALSGNQKTPLWIGEYGFWSTEADVLAIAERFAGDQDRNGLGGAWWQWRQPCGDPHSLHRVDGDWVPYQDITHLHAFDCTAGIDLGGTEEFLRILGRGYPRVTAGRINSLESNPHTGQFSLEGNAISAGQELVVWTPTSDDTHEITVEGIEDLDVSFVEGGRVIRGFASQAGLYTLNIDVQ